MNYCYSTKKVYERQNNVYIYIMHIKVAYINIWAIVSFLRDNYKFTIIIYNITKNKIIVSKNQKRKVICGENSLHRFIKRLYCCWVLWVEELLLRIHLALCFLCVCRTHYTIDSFYYIGLQNTQRDVPSFILTDNGGGTFSKIRSLIIQQDKFLKNIR